MRQPIADQIAQRLHAIAFRRQRRVHGDRAFKLERVSRIELAIHVGMYQQIVGHGSSTPRAAITRLRARASRDITVPIGTPVTPAMSRYSRPFTSRSTSVSRNDTGSAAI